MLRTTVPAVLLLAITTAATPARADSQQLWAHTYPGQGACGLAAVSTAIDTQSGAVFAAYHDFECGPNAPLLVGYTAVGTRKWAVENTSHDDVPAGVTVDPATHTVLMASTRNGSTMLIQAFDPGDGHELWGKGLVAGGSASFHTVGVAVDGHGRAVVTGTNDDLGISVAGFQVTNGTTLWHVHYDGQNHLGASAVGIGIDPSLNRAYVVGTAFNPHGEENLATVAYSTASGNVAWAKEESAFSARPTGVAVDPGNHRVYSLTGDLSTAGAHTYAYSRTGARQWSKAFTGTGGFLPYEVAVDTGNHQIYIAGDDGDNFDTTLVAYTATGTQRWSDTDLAADQARPQGLAADAADHRVYVTSTVGPSTTHIVTFADTAAGARQWHTSHVAAHTSAAAGALAVDSTRTQVYVAGNQATASALAIAYHG